MKITDIKHFLKKVELFRDLEDHELEHNPQ
jgi:hypothetical protein